VAGGVEAKLEDLGELVDGGLHTYDVLWYLRHVLQNEGYCTRHTRSAEQALVAARRAWMVWLRQRNRTATPSIQL
jgi:hypothetical protein